MTGGIPQSQRAQNIAQRGPFRPESSVVAVEVEASVLFKVNAYAVCVCAGILVEYMFAGRL